MRTPLRQEALQILQQEKQTGEVPATSLPDHAEHISTQRTEGYFYYWVSIGREGSWARGPDHHASIKARLRWQARRGETESEAALTDVAESTFQKKLVSRAPTRCFRDYLGEQTLFFILQEAAEVTIRASPALMAEHSWKREQIFKNLF